ncbi:MarR family transcriptional regulator [Streptomyces sp. NBC_00433]
MSNTAPELNGRLGHLMKHAQLRLTELSAEALAPFGVTGRELAVLLVLAGQEAASQQQAAGRLGVDRTTMVAFLDALEGRGLVARRPDPDDRRRNVVVLTVKGADTLRQATEASDAAERRFLAPLSAPDAARFRAALQAVALHEDASG